ncbi:MAG: hypothetical protein LBT53_02555 [Puniceicoccales bacterium]|jgi:DNA polymerase-3 subunit delta|nr:hypothetical protein [Puniceicoccales bacterium]
MVPKFYFFTGDDDYLVDAAARECYSRLAQDTDEFSREIIDGSASKIEEADKMLDLFLSAIKTIPLFGGKKCVWLRGINWLSRTSRLVSGDEEGGSSGGGGGENADGDDPAPVSEKTASKKEKEKGSEKGYGEILCDGLQNLDPENVALVVSAHSPDGVRKEVKWLKTNGETKDFPAAGDRKNSGAREAMLDGILENEATLQKISIPRNVREELLAKVGGNIRLAVEEVRKLACYTGEGGKISADDVMRLVPDFGEGDFFEAAEAFYAANPEWALDALHRFFFKNVMGGRALHATMLKRNRLLIQLRALLDAGVQVGNGFGRGADNFKKFFGDNSEKSELNVFTQHPFYLSRLAPSVRKFSLKKLIDIQLGLAEVFMQMIARSTDHEGVFREFFSEQLT